ncbi:hypothetical protein GCM10027187_56010 [Streptosporangium sandarakinum]
MTAPGENGILIGVRATKGGGEKFMLKKVLAVASLTVSLSTALVAGSVSTSYAASGCKLTKWLGAFGSAEAYCTGYSGKERMRVVGDCDLGGTYTRYGNWVAYANDVSSVNCGGAGKLLAARMEFGSGM